MKFTSPDDEHADLISVISFFVVLCACIGVWINTIMDDYDLHKNGKIVACTVHNGPSLYSIGLSSDTHPSYFRTTYRVTCGDLTFYIDSDDDYQKGQDAEVYYSTTNPENAVFRQSYHPYTLPGLIFSWHTLFCLLLNAVAGLCFVVLLKSYRRGKRGRGF